MNIVQKIRSRTDENSVTAVKTGKISVSYERLFSDLDSAVMQLARHGVQANDKVALLAKDSYEYIVFSLAILELKAAIVPIPANSSASEVKSMLDKIKIKHIIFTPPYYSASDASTLETSGLENEKYFFLTLRDDISTPILPEPMQAAFIRFSSGTTGLSKGVILSHQTIIERTAAANKALKINYQDNILWVLDMSFHFVVTILLFLRQRATIVLCSSPLAENMSKALAENKISVIYATPYHYSMMSRFDSFKTSMFKNLRLAISTAMKLHPDVSKMFQQKFRHRITQAYGIIEVGLVFINDSENPDKIDSTGRSINDYQVKILNPDKQGRGEILLKGPGMFDAYYEPFRLREEILCDGWFATGDIGKIDNENYLYIVGRSKNVINFVGMKIFPYEVEQVLLSHPAVNEAKVEARAHENFGEIPIAFIVLIRESNGDIEQELRKFCIKHLASYCVPKEFNFVDKLPKTKSGKILRT